MSDELLEAYRTAMRREHKREYMREWYLLNRERIIVTNREYKREYNCEYNREYNREYSRAWYLRNREYKREYKREYNLRNRDRVLDHKREYNRAYYTRQKNCITKTERLAFIAAAKQTLRTKRKVNKK